MGKSKQEMTYTCPVCDAYCATEKDDYFDDDCILVCGKGHWTAPKRLWPATHILKPLSARAFVDSFDSTLVFTMRHHDVDYVKLADYERLAASMGKKIDESAPWKPRTVGEWADGFFSIRGVVIPGKHSSTMMSRGTIVETVRGVRAECARVVREFKAQRSPQVELCETCLDRVADVVELLP